MPPGVRRIDEATKSSPNVTLPACQTARGRGFPMDLTERKPARALIVAGTESPAPPWTAVPDDDARSEPQPQPQPAPPARPGPQPAPLQSGAALPGPNVLAHFGFWNVVKTGDGKPQACTLMSTRTDGGSLGIGAAADAVLRVVI